MTMEQTENTELKEKKTFKELWMERPWIRATALTLSAAMIFGLVGHGLHMYMLNRAYAKEEESQISQQQAIDEKQTAYETAYSMAASSAESGNYDEALTYINECLQYVEAGSEQETTLLTTRASLNILLGNNEEALPDLQSVMQAAPESQDVLLLKSQTELGSGDYDQATADMEAYLEMNPEDYDVRLSLTQIYEALEKNQQAADSYLELQKLRPGDMDLKLSSARAQILAENIPQAIEMLDPVLEMGNDGQKTTASFLLALALMQSQDFENAIAQFETAVERGYEPVICLEQIAACAFISGDYDQVMNCEKRILKADPEGSQEASFYQQLGVSAMAQENYPLGIQKLTRGIELDPQFPGSYYYRGLCNFSLGMWGRAADDFTASIEQGYLTQNCYYNRGLCYAQRLDYNKAASDMQKTLTEGDDLELIQSASQLLPSLQAEVDKKK